RRTRSTRACSPFSRTPSVAARRPRRWFAVFATGSSPSRRSSSRSARSSTARASFQRSPPRSRGRLSCSRSRSRASEADYGFGSCAAVHLRPVTAAAFLQVLNQLVYLAVAIAVIVEAGRRPRRTSIYTALFFTALALIRGVPGLSSQLGFALPPLATLGLASLLLALPYVQMRLLDDFVGVGVWTKRAAFAGLVLSIGSMIVVPSPIPGILTLALVFYFVTLLGYCAVRFLRESQRAHDLVAARLFAVALRSGLLSLVLAVAVIVPFVLRGGADVTRLVTQLVILAAGIAYFVGFAPP